MTASSPLVQIRSVYRTEWKNLTFSVESGMEEWTTRVEDADTHRLLYTARRSGVSAAQIAAAEYGISYHLGFASSLVPQRLAAELPWRQQF